MPMNEDMRAKNIRRSLEALPDAHETLRVPWKEGIIHCDVIKIPISSLVLNPRSHRIKAQLESDSKITQLIETDPFSDEVQAAIASLLRFTTGFGDLKASLAAESQPGERDCLRS